MRFKYLLILISSVFIIACSEEPVAPSVEDEVFGFEKPPHFPEPEYDFDKNPITRKGFELGKRLFMDGILSRDNTISCASCHSTGSAFTQHGHDLSHGIEDRLTMRNSQPVQNLAWNTSFAWDGGVDHLDLFAPLPIENPVEMDDELSAVLEKLRQHKDYPELFAEAFADGEISTANFLKALSQFQLMCISANSKYDNYLLGNVSLTTNELNGLETFEAKCTTCHSGVLQTDNSFRNNGLEVDNAEDLGRALITEQDTDNYKFRVPSLRNLAYTFPFMHDGRFQTLDEVLEHYTQGIIQSETLDPQLKDGIDLSEAEKENLKAFLNTLNDESFVKNKDIRVF